MNKKTIHTITKIILPLSFATFFLSGCSVNNQITPANSKIINPPNAQINNHEQASSSPITVDDSSCGKSDSSHLYIMIKGLSMEPFLKNGQCLVFNPTDKKINRGDVVVFKYPVDEQEITIKRVVGLPGENMTIKDGAVSINGSALNESSYLTSRVTTTGDVSINLGNDEYYVLGDNRGASKDSRSYGPVKGEKIVGKFVQIIQ